MIVFYGYAIKKNGKFLGFVPQVNERGKLYMKRFYKRPKFPVVSALNAGGAYESEGERVVRVRLTMEECEAK